jgi:hypothetical protein
MSIGPTDSCAFLPCDQVTECSLVGGCVNRQGHKRAPLGAAPTLHYNPATGGRYDLEIKTEDPGATERWTNKRIAYLRELLKGDLTPQGRACYQRELEALIVALSNRK